MRDVRLSIAGRDYTVACAPGEEPHLATLGQMIDAKLSSLPNVSGQSDVRRFLYAALLLADELHERQAGRDPSPEGQHPAEALEALADRLEGLALELEGDGMNDAAPPPARHPSPQ